MENRKKIVKSVGLRVIGAVVMIVTVRAFYMNEEERYLWKFIFCQVGAGVYREATKDSVEDDLGRSGFEYERIGENIYKIEWEIRSLKMVGVIDMARKQVKNTCYRWGVVPIRKNKWEWNHKGGR